MDIPGVEIPQEQLLILLVPMANYLVIAVLKGIGIVLDGEEWNRVNIALAAAIGGGIGLMADGEALPRVIVAALAAGVTALGSIAIHHAGSTVRAKRTKLRADALAAENAALIAREEPVAADDPAP